METRQKEKTNAPRQKITQGVLEFFLVLNNSFRKKWTELDIIYMKTKHQCIVNTVKELFQEITKKRDKLLKTRNGKTNTKEKRSIYTKATPDGRNKLINCHWFLLGRSPEIETHLLMGNHDQTYLNLLVRHFDSVSRFIPFPSTPLHN